MESKLKDFQAKEQLRNDALAAFNKTSGKKFTRQELAGLKVGDLQKAASYFDQYNNYSKQLTTLQGEYNLNIPSTSTTLTPEEEIAANWSMWNQ